MLSLPAGTRIYLAVEPVDMRKQFDGLWSVAKESLGEDPRAGAFFVFTNKRRNRLKILYFDGTGPWIFAKRPEEGCFSWPLGSNRRKLSLMPEALTMLLAGIDQKDGHQKDWYERKKLANIVMIYWIQRHAAGRGSHSGERAVARRHPGAR